MGNSYLDEHFEFVRKYLEQHKDDPPAAEKTSDTDKEYQRHANAVLYGLVDAPVLCEEEEGGGTPPPGGEPPSGSDEPPTFSPTQRGPLFHTYEEVALALQLGHTAIAAKLGHPNTETILTYCRMYQQVGVFTETNGWWRRTRDEGMNSPSVQTREEAARDALGEPPVQTILNAMVAYHKPFTREDVGATTGLPRNIICWVVRIGQAAKLIREVPGHRRSLVALPGLADLAALGHKHGESRQALDLTFLILTWAQEVVPEALNQDLQSRYTVPEACQKLMLEERGVARTAAVWKGMAIARHLIKMGDKLKDASPQTQLRKAVLDQKNSGAGIGWLKNKDGTSKVKMRGAGKNTVYWYPTEEEEARDVAAKK